ncbi:MAG: 1-acyl-sn-glycerol-3-phosphate acyltransferase [Acidimicrobiaceae bacterium]|nr:1-acyl-sn-glycerol-3-phosphate acyltransferase [Acidimicrobiaceae bacterium]
MLRRHTFPYTKPTWPGGVARPPVERKLGVDYDTEWARRYPTRLARAVVLDNLGRPLVRALASPHIEGLDRVEHLEGPAIFAANHASHVDTPLLLTTLPDRFRHRTAIAAGADYFFDKRWKATFWAFLINAFPIERIRVSRRGADLAGQLLSEGWSLVIFPEGGRSPDGWAQEHRPGAAFLSVRHGVPIVPVHLEGTRRILRRGAKTLTPSSTTVTFGSPLRPDEGEDSRLFATRVERAVAALADERATDWWTARRRAAAGATPVLSGPAAGTWRRAWALNEGRRSGTDRERPWPPR